jgi:hypothetical protein
VDLVIDFLNTVDHDEGTDVLADPAAWSSWLAGRGLSDVSPAAVRSARDALRVAVGDTGLAGSFGASVRVSLRDGVPVVVADDVVGAVLAAASRLAVLDQWERVKICPAQDCRWAFYDRSRNHSRTWCSMQICGNRQKARAWRERTGH